MNNERFSRLEANIDRMCDKINKIEATLAVNTATLIEHQRRSLALENNVSILNNHYNKLLGALIVLNLVIPIVLKFFL